MNALLINNSANCRQNISFTSTIEIISRQKLNSLISQSTKVGHLFDPYEITTGKNLYTLGVDICSAGGMITNKEKLNSMYHIAPTVDNFDDLTNYGACSGIFAKKMTENIGNEPPINGFEFGGKKLKEAPNRAGLSFDVFDNIHKFISSKIKDFSYFRGLKGVIADLHYSSDCDTWSIFFNDISIPKSPKDLTNICDDIYISSKDLLKINGKIVTKKDYPNFFKKSKVY